MTNSEDPDQLASSEANWSGSTLFAKTGHIVFSKRRVTDVHIEVLISNKYSDTCNAVLILKCVVRKADNTNSDQIFTSAVWSRSAQFDQVQLSFLAKDNYGNVLKFHTLTLLYVQTLQTQIRLLQKQQSDQGLHYLSFHQEIY